MMTKTKTRLEMWMPNISLAKHLPVVKSFKDGVIFRYYIPDEQ